MQKTLILGSSSPYRKMLLERLKMPFECHTPDINEERLNEESAEQLVKRLSINKALKIDQERREHGPQKKALIIGSDQVATLNGRVLGKPHSEKNAIKQLEAFSNQKVSFLTGLCVYNQQSQHYSYELSEYHVYFRKLTHKEIVNYIKIEQPLDCAGSFKCEGLGISLFEKMEGNDPNSLIGLPLISLCKLLREQGVNPIAIN